MTERSRSFTWEDPMIGAKQARAMSGLAYIEAMRDGLVPPPPIAVLVGMALTEVNEGRVVFALTTAEWQYNPIGSVHGGIAATLLDSAMGCAIHTMLPQGVGYSTLELSVNYTRGMSAATGTVYAIGEALHVGRQSATAQGRIVDAEGKLYAHGTTTCIVLR
ncbi:MAG: PaaI family thioesterase [Anaerolineae bacterium]